MRSILILALFGSLLLLPGVNFAETNAECQSRCTDEKAAKETNCPPGEDTDQERTQCLQEAQDTYNSCLNGCPQSESSETPTEN